MEALIDYFRQVLLILIDPLLWILAFGAFFFCRRYPVRAYAVVLLFGVFECAVVLYHRTGQRVGVEEILSQSGPHIMANFLLVAAFFGIRRILIERKMKRMKPER
ncbi:hypothetical protein LJB86_03725 [Deltaproteobacteria bacterium OttesenSCG-928-M10]|nr:hypothetical protein [Deltaproteobacteria bacterium OttesenSCG-928-M10]